MMKLKPFSSRSLLFTLRAHFTSQSTQESAPILFDYPKKTLCNVLLNRPRALNSLSYDMLKLLNTELMKWSKDPHLKLVIFEGTGSKAFCSGRDIRSLYDIKDKPDSERFPYIEDYLRTELTTEYLLGKMKPIQLSVWDGVTMGGGLGISVHSKIKIATERTLLAMPVAGIGYFADDGGSYFLSRMRKNLGFLLGLANKRLKGKEAVQAGVADYYIASEKIENYLNEIRLVPDDQITLEKLQEISSTYSEKVEKRFENEDEIEELFSGTTFKEVYESLQQKSKQSSAAKEILTMIDKQCPRSVFLIFEQLIRARKLAVEECYQSDFTIGQHIVRDSDFYEGIRGTLVDKANPPHWKHESPLDVPRDIVEGYFSPRSGHKPLNLEFEDYYIV